MKSPLDFLQRVGDLVGVGIGSALFSVTCVLALLLTLPMTRSKWPPRNSLQSHLYSIGIGVSFLFMVCGRDAWIMLLQVALGYLAIRLCSPSFCHIVVLIEAMSILAVVHVHRLVSIGSPSEGQEDFDISFPLMISTQKLTCLAFGIHDGHKQQQQHQQEREREAAADSSPAHVRRRTHNGISQSARSSEQPINVAGTRHYHVYEAPSLMVYFDYMLYFQGVLIGPPCFYPEFLSYLNSREERPSRKSHLGKNILVSIVFAAIHFGMKPVFPTHLNKDPSAFLQWSFPYRLWYAFFSLFICRFKFYCAWTAGEALQVAAGLGFNPATRRWNKLCNVDPLRLELSTSPKAYIDCWNTQTNEWLRYLAYHRLPTRLRTVSTFLLSAVWHGFYPGYYFTFLFAVPLTHASRKLRRCLRPWFVLRERRKQVYDLLTWVATHIAMSSLVMPFILLDFHDSLTFYTYNQFWWFQIATLVVLIVPLPNLQRLLHASDTAGISPRREPGTM